ncbi:unnamed protein product [Arctogadus glacialis]
MDMLLPHSEPGRRRRRDDPDCSASLRSYSERPRSVTLRGTPRPYGGPPDPTGDPQTLRGTPGPYGDPPRSYRDPLDPTGTTRPYRDP